MPSGGFHRQHMMGTLHYTAPEVLMKQVADFASDLYSLAVTCCELATCVAPFSDRARNVALAHTVLDLSYNDMDLAAAIASEGLRPQLPAGAAEPYPGFSALLERCWAPEAARRPAAAEAAAAMAEGAAALCRTEGVGALKALWGPPPAEAEGTGAVDAAMDASAADSLLTGGAQCDPAPLARSLQLSLPHALYALLGKRKRSHLRAAALSPPHRPSLRCGAVVGGAAGERGLCACRLRRGARLLWRVRAHPLTRSTDPPALHPTTRHTRPWRGRRASALCAFRQAQSHWMTARAAPFHPQARGGQDGG